jgi:quercetin dioxygenase-like cupin family protein
VDGFRLLRGDRVERNTGDGWEYTPLHPDVTGAREVMMGIFRTGPGMRIPPHHHTCETIAYLVRGRAAFSAGDERLEMSPGDFVYVGPGVVHTEETIGEDDAEFILARDKGGAETIPVDPEDPFWNQ